MMKVKRLVAVAATVALVAAVALPAFAAGKDVTVGRFVQELAKTKNLNATDARIAADSLAAVGVRLPAGTDLSKRLTEADVATISRLAGLRVSTSNPADSFDSDEVERFFLAFASELGAGDDGAFATNDDDDDDGDGPGFNPYTKGKGGSKGKKKGQGGPLSPSEPE